VVRSGVGPHHRCEPPFDMSARQGACVQHDCDIVAALSFRPFGKKDRKTLTSQRMALIDLVNEYQGNRVFAMINPVEEDHQVRHRGRG